MKTPAQAKIEEIGRSFRKQLRSNPYTNSQFLEKRKQQAVWEDQHIEYIQTEINTATRISNMDYYTRLLG